MKFIKTCYGEWVNPAHVKHFGLKSRNDGGTDYLVVVADGITITVFKYEKPPEMTLQEWFDTGQDALSKQARAKACAWLAELVAKLNKENDQ